MKSKILIFLSGALLLAACSKEEATQPVASIEIDLEKVDINKTLTIRFTGSAENIVIFPGDVDHDYELLDEGNSGLVVNKGVFTYSYTTPGVYKIVCVATNHAQEGTILLTDTCSKYVRVIDDVTEIERLSAPQVLYDEVFARLHGDSDWVLALPKKIRFNNGDRNVALTQRLKFYLPSQTTEFLIDGAPYKSTTRYNLANPVEIIARSHEGTERKYRLHAINYGEFESFSLAGVKGTLTRNEFDYANTEMTIAIPAGTDLKSLVPDFKIPANVKVYVGDMEQTSGTPVDFSAPVTYRFIAASASDPSLTVESTCRVSVTKK